MNIDWTHFTPWASLAGGILIGISTAIFILFNGRIVGISSILGGLLRPARNDILWQVAFLAGLVIAPLLYAIARPLPETVVDADAGILITAGLLVGIGIRYGAGCTSGHRVCGIAQLSPRSLVATICFTAAGFATVFIVRHLLA
ncbi:YeeE/YedE family protein [Noviherbaspirillum sp. L7-7A]|uniref:YeeE/YedE family protein n=1 Tax=Noviherbaspirillum sp. L7-7A TaxID=2850560 RepID=UPI001C2C5C88|nr:YeeE/YedE family protein [Noviherbaspirillum sp. L7-7A]MBV0881371.1 YeeE/YedE family protein [Noviherbaspirillum sp. L7-7A]